jgi:hypothetical protein
MQRLSHASGPGTALRVLLVAALLAVAADADAKGKRGGSSSSSSSSSKSTSTKHDDDKKDKGITVNIRSGSSSSSSSGTGSSFSSPGGMGGHMVPIPAAQDPEEAARRAAQMAAIERQQAEKASQMKALEEKMEAERLAAEKAAAERAAQRAAEEKAEAARQQAALEKKKREDAVVAADVDRVLERARTDYPVLRTPEGEPMMQAILARQQVLVKRGMYPSIAMVEAIADHSHALATAQKRETMVTPVVVTPASTGAAQQPATGTQSSAFGGCRWVTPTQWSCK